WGVVRERRAAGTAIGLRNARRPTRGFARARSIGTRSSWLPSCVGMSRRSYEPDRRLGWSPERDETDMGALEDGNDVEHGGTPGRCVEATPASSISVPIGGDLAEDLGVAPGVGRGLAGRASRSRLS